MADQFKNPVDQSNFLQKDLAKRISRNPAYRQMAQYASGAEKHPANDELFYAFKDAYERSRLFNDYEYMPEDEISDTLSDRYYELQDYDYDSHGLIPGSRGGDSEWETYYAPAFEKIYGTHDDFVKKGTDAWKRYMLENFGGHTEDHQGFGRFIQNHPERFKEPKALDDYYKDWAGPGVDSYQELLAFWKNKLYGGK